MTRAAGRRRPPAGLAPSRAPLAPPPPGTRAPTVDARRLRAEGRRRPRRPGLALFGRLPPTRGAPVSADSPAPAPHTHGRSLSSHTHPRTAHRPALSSPTHVSHAQIPQPASLRQPSHRLGSSENSGDLVQSEPRWESFLSREPNRFGCRLNFI